MWTTDRHVLLGLVAGLWIGSLVGGFLGSWIRGKICDARRDLVSDRTKEQEGIAALGARRFIDPETGQETGERPAHLPPEEGPLATRVGDPLESP